MSLLAMERVKLFSTRSPWWCAMAAVAVTAALGTLVTGSAGAEATVSSTQFADGFGMVVVMLLATLSVTTEYRFGTLNTTFQAVPKRIPALLAKTAVVAVTALVIGELAAFGAWLAGTLVAPGRDLALRGTADWLAVAGAGPVFAGAAILSVAVGLLVRHSAGAVAVVVIYSQLVEQAVGAIPSAGEAIHPWLPFVAAGKFLTGNGESNGGRDGGYGLVLSDSPLGQGWALAYFAAFALLLLGIALARTARRDA
jgi:ABC-2 type transport system permease protein